MEHYFPATNEEKKNETRSGMGSKIKINKRMSGIVIRSHRSILNDGVFMVRETTIFSMFLTYPTTFKQILHEFTYNCLIIIIHKFVSIVPYPIGCYILTL